MQIKLILVTASVHKVTFDQKWRIAHRGMFACLTLPNECTRIKAIEMPIRPHKQCLDACARTDVSRFGKIFQSSSLYGILQYLMKQKYHQELTMRGWGG